MIIIIIWITLRQVLWIAPFLVLVLKLLLIQQIYKKNIYKTIFIGDQTKRNNNLDNQPGNN